MLYTQKFTLLGNTHLNTLTIVLFALGLVLLVAGAELLVRGASRLAVAVGISPLVVGLTVVAFGTSSPELAVSVQSAFAGNADIAIGNVVGSNIFNVLLILGLSAAVAPLVVAQQLVRLDVPLLIGVSVLLWVFCADGSLARWEAIILAAGVAFYTIFLIRQSRREQRAVEKEYEEGFGQDSLQSPGQWLLNTGYVVLGLMLLVLGSRWLVNGATVFAEALGVSQLIIGLTIVAAGTSLPELATSVVASLRGQRDIAVGNVVGSNLFNILAVLGIAGSVSPNAIPISQHAIYFDIPIATAVAVACLPIFFAGYRISRWNGWLFLSYYVIYTVYLILRTTDSPVLPLFTQALLFFIVPLTVVTLSIVTINALRIQRRVSAE